ncbi:hypothetical protein [Methylobacter sp.]|uniref:hypothetical protein n=1 Tax=Methylobacter sp. TaxID=2051955 RepID=UPI002489E1D3|nr:hypothetical protein [Methylobacter sp.]MDI1279276.1 hypothetical protein [Methylobacter sp.]
MTLQSRLTGLTQAIGINIKALYGKFGPLTALNTTAKTDVVTTVNEVFNKVGALIDDLAAPTVTNKTYSAQKITTLVEAAKAALVDTAPAALNTLNELATALANDPNFATTNATALGNRVRIDAAQVFTALQQSQARSNINAASATDLDTLNNALGVIDTDFCRNLYDG